MTPFKRSVRRVTDGELGHTFGCDWDRRLVVTLAPGDVIVFRPHGTRREVSATAVDLYRYVIKCEANKAFLERARARKERKAERLAAERLKRAERRLFARADAEARGILEKIGGAR